MTVQDTMTMPSVEVRRSLLATHAVHSVSALVMHLAGLTNVSRERTVLRLVALDVPLHKTAEEDVVWEPTAFSREQAEVAERVLARRQPLDEPPLPLV